MNPSLLFGKGEFTIFYVDRSIINSANGFVGKKGFDTKQKMIEVMASLLEEEGYERAGLSELGKETGTPKGSLYFHFPGGKDELTSLAILYSGKQLNDFFLNVFGNCDSPQQAIKQVFHALEERIVTSNFQKGCPIATTAMETAGKTAIVSDACKDVYALWIKTFETYLVGSGYTSRLAKTLSLSIFALWEGALLLSKLQKSAEPLRMAEKTAESLLKQT
ncbi:TetR/AcrR family transcriptional regulator [Leptospira biflexa]|jgi:TetR/AcrR family transcriptional repressor of lmrAB and yxaGH operons|uniref:TetR/AcrR family transcriptional regulator n=1 Tax=Leptospira biflexa TaxID=172 RepID=UPI00109118D8|nr:TetR/AcrR family transcriptional regulator [Leptospira biflexa]TGM55821.1 TetR/AcrR family transcriptional regulator [Leptospira biflexa]